MRPIILPLLGVLALAGCDKPGDGTSISIKDDGGNTVASADGSTGQVKLDLPGFSGNIKLPKVQLDAGNFDLNGVHLYPGSKIDSFNLNVGRNGGRGDDNGGIRVGFTSPASPATVRDWLAERLNRAKFQVRADGTGLTGTTDEDKPFRLTLDPEGSDRARGTITIG